jgi:riboflavin kinase/FMN adenylyltransferase
MNIIGINEPIPAVKKSVLSVGNFDGMHNGHRYLINTVCERARVHKAESVIITFEPHTRAYLNPEKMPPRLTTFSEKALLLRDYPIDYLVCLAFNNHLASMPPDKFVTDILIRQFNIVEWVMGENHAFGKERKGTHNFLHNLDVRNHFNVFPVNLHTEDASIASSTKIRTLIGERRIDDAVKMLGHPYSILAERIRGLRKGFELGYPTLNFKCPPSEKVIPPPGVYAAEVEYGDIRLSGALYFGNCPTYENRDYHFEFHSLEPITFDPGIHTETALWLHRFIRADKTFASEALLVQQITKDIDKIKQFFNKE